MTGFYQPLPQRDEWPHIPVGANGENRDPKLAASPHRATLSIRDKRLVPNACYAKGGPAFPWFIADPVEVEQPDS
jgi:hypothetical protein